MANAENSTSYGASKAEKQMISFVTNDEIEHNCEFGCVMMSRMVIALAGFPDDEEDQLEVYRTAVCSAIRAV